MRRICLQIVSVHNTDPKSALPENLSLWLHPKHTSHSCSSEILQSQSQQGAGQMQPNSMMVITFLLKGYIQIFAIIL